LLNNLITTWRFVLKRSLAHWRLLSTVVVGVVLASAIMSGTVIYFDSLKELALDETLDSVPRDDLDIVVKAVRGPTTPTEYGKVDAAVSAVVDSHVGWFVGDRIFAGGSATFFRSEVGEEAEAGNDNARAYFTFVPRLSEFVAVVAGGTVPSDAAISEPGQPLVLQAMVPEVDALAAGVEVGDVIAVIPFWDDQIPYAHVQVTALLRPLDPTARFWSLDEKVLGAATGDSFSTVPLFISETAFFEVLGRSFADMDTTYGWLLEVQPDRIDADSARNGQLSVQLMGDRLNSTLFAYRQFTTLDRVLGVYDQRLFFSKLPMFVVMILVAVVILYYVVTLSALLIERQRGEIALLRSRGAGTSHLVSIFALEGITVSVLATVVGPLLAAAAISAAGFTPAFSGLSATRGLDVDISAAAYGLSALGGLFSFGALMIPAIQAARMSVTGHRRESARPEGLPLYQRYYLDVLLLIVSIVLFRQLTQQGSVVATRLFGDVAVNQLILAVPAVTLLAASMVLLRIFPLVMRLASRLFSSVLPAGLALGLWQMARNPTYYARLSLLLILTAGLGIFAASFGGTLDRSFQERVFYSTGSDLRVGGLVIDASGTTRPMTASYEEVEGVDTASPTFRGRAFDLTSLVSEEVGVLAVSSDSFNDVGWYRDDFSDKSISDLLTSLRPQDGPVGIPLPEDARTIGIIGRVDRPQPSMRLAARVVDANDRYFTYDLGNLTSADWQFYEVPLSRASRFRTRLLRLEPVWPLRLMSIGVEETDTQRGTFAGSLIVDDIRVRTGDGTVLVIEGFDDLSGWSILKTTADSESDSARPSTLGYESDDAKSLRFTWTEGPALSSRGVFYGPQVSSLPVAASDSFVDSSGHSVGDAFTLSLAGHRVRVHIVGTFGYFPTLDTENETFLVADLAALISYANVDPSASELKPNEVWIASGATGAEREELRSTLLFEPFGGTRVEDRELLLSLSQVDPLTKAGWRALLFIAFGAVFILSCLGFVVHAHVSFTARRVQFALLRTVGLSRLQLATVVLLEQSVVIAAGMALGAWMGGRLGAIIMPFLANDEFGTQVLPPFVVEVDWAVLGVTYAAMVLVFLVITAALIWFVQRISVVRTLRLGEN
jgi:hypothetical protein